MCVDDKCKSVVVLYIAQFFGLHKDFQYKRVTQRC